VQYADYTCKKAALVAGEKHDIDMGKYAKYQ
jgi:hypothetical protein